MTFLDRAKRLLFIGDMRRRTRNKSHRDIDRVGNEKRKNASQDIYNQQCKRETTRPQCSTLAKMTTDIQLFYLQLYTI